MIGAPGRQERWIDAEAAEAAGYTLVDLSDDWTPYIFAEQTGPDGPAAAEPVPADLHRPRQRRARRGRRAAGAGRQELPRALRDLPLALGAAARFIDDEQHPCHDQESADALEAVETVTYVAPADIKKDERTHGRIRQELERGPPQGEGRHAGGAGRASSRAFAPKVKLLAQRAAEKPAMAAVEKRLTCEGLLRREEPSTGRASTTTPMRLAVRRFQQKHMIYEANYLRRKTVDALARPLLDNDYDGLVRAVRERVVSAAAILEDGSPRRPRNLVDEYTKVAVEQLQLGDAQAALAFFKRHPATEFKHLKVGRSSCRRRPPTTPSTWTCRSSSTAATSGTTCRSTPAATTSRQPRKKYPHAHRLREGGRQAGRAVALAHDDRGLARRAGAERVRILPLQDVGRRPAGDPATSSPGPVWIAPGLDPDPVADQGEDGQRQVDAGGELRRARPWLPVGLRPHRRLLRRAGAERSQRLRQRRARARLVGLPVDLQRQRLLARLPPAPEPPRDPDVLVHPAAPDTSGWWATSRWVSTGSSSGRTPSTRCGSRRAGTSTSSIRRCR